MKNIQSQTTLATLANIAELTASVVRCVVGNELADSLDGVPAKKEVVYNFAMSEVQKRHAVNLESK